MISIWIAAAILAQQVSPTGPATIRVSGRVINSLNGEGVPKATVVLRARDEEHGFNNADETDGDGHFSMDNVEPGTYVLVAGRSGFVMESRGATGAPRPDINVEAGQQIKDVTIRLNPLGVISGRVLDSDGDPVRGARVQALVYAYSAGKKEMRDVEEVQSGDNGDFRLFGLRAATFYLKATRVHQSGELPAVTFSGYFPNASDESLATPIPLRTGAQLQGFEIRLPSTGGHSISVKFSEPDALGTRTDVFLLTDRGTMSAQEAAYTSDGVVFNGVPPGAYEVVALRQIEGEKKSYARQSVEVANADVDEGTLIFLPSVDVKGTVRVEGGAFSGLAGLRISLQSSHPTPMMGNESRPSEVKPDGSFLLEDVTPGIYEIAINRTAGVYLKWVRMGDKQLADRRLDSASKLEPLTVVIGADVGEVEGSVQNAKGDPVVRARVNVIGYGDNASRTDFNRFGFTDEKGDFKIKNVPPGDYKVFAWEDVQVGAPQDPEFRRPFEKQASSLKMQPNGHETVQVRAISAAQVGRSSQ